MKINCYCWNCIYNGKDAMNLDGNLYYISTYQTRSKDNPNSEWIEDEKLKSEIVKNLSFGGKL